MAIQPVELSVPDSGHQPLVKGGALLDMCRGVMLPLTFETFSDADNFLEWLTFSKNINPIHCSQSELGAYRGEWENTTKGQGDP